MPDFSEILQAATRTRLATLIVQCYNHLSLHVPAQAPIIGFLFFFLNTIPSSGLVMTWHGLKKKPLEEYENSKHTIETAWLIGLFIGYTLRKEYHETNIIIIMLFVRLQTVDAHF